jgi:hypothetical protein
VLLVTLDLQVLEDLKDHEDPLEQLDLLVLLDLQVLEERPVDEELKDQQDVEALLDLKDLQVLLGFNLLDLVDLVD